MQFSGQARLRCQGFGRTARLQPVNTRLKIECVHVLFYYRRRFKSFAYFGRTALLSLSSSRGHLMNHLRLARFLRLPSPSHKPMPRTWSIPRFSLVASRCSSLSFNHPITTAHARVATEYQPGGIGKPEASMWHICTNVDPEKHKQPPMQIRTRSSFWLLWLEEAVSRSVLASA